MKFPRAVMRCSKASAGIDAPEGAAMAQTAHDMNIMSKVGVSAHQGSLGADVKGRTPSAALVTPSSLFL